MIHLELLRMRLTDKPDATEHLSVIAAQVRRLDEVVQGFLKFTRPEDLRLQPVWLGEIIEELMPIVQAEASKSQVDVRIDVPPTLPPVNADTRMLLQAFLNLALNACQAMPQGGRLRIAARERPHRQVEIVFEDTGVGISAERSVPDLRSVLHDQGLRERDRPLARVPHDPAARRRYRGAIGPGPGHDVLEFGFGRQRIFWRPSSRFLRHN